MRLNLPSAVLLAVLLMAPGAASGADECRPGLDPLVSETPLTAPGSSLLGTSVAVGSEGRPDHANLILVGAPGASPVGAPTTAGAAFLFERSGLDWELTSPPFSDNQPGARFGWSVAISLDGNLLAVGAPLDNEKGTSAGAVHLFERNGDGWTHLKLAGNDTNAFDAFGFSLALNGLQPFLVVGAPLHDAQGLGNSGAVYVFERGEGGWVQTAKLTAPDAERDDQLGTAVDVDILGLRVAAGAPQPEPRVVGDPSTGRPGKVWVFERIQDGWSPVARLAAEGGSPFDAFGFAVALAGSSVAVGAPGADAESGAVFLFQRQAGGSWPETSTPLPVCHREAGAELGFSLSEDGDTLVVGARRDEGRKGSVYIFQIGEEGERVRIRNLEQIETGDELGRSVAIREGVLAAGAPLADVEGATDAGIAFAFGLAGLSLSQSSPTLVPGTPTLYKTSVVNRSSRDLNGVRVSLTFDSRLTGVRITCSSGNQNASCCGNGCHVDPGENTLIDDQVVLPEGAEVTYLLEATVPPGMRGDAQNRASVDAPSGFVDPIPEDNLLFKPFPVAPQANLAVVLQAEVPGGGPVIAGQSRIRYTITATNQGPSDATDVVVTVDLPGDVKRLSSRPSQGSVQQAGGQKIRWNVGQLSPGTPLKATSSTLEIEAEVLPRARQPLVTRTYIEGAEPDSSPEDNSTTKTLGPVETHADLEVTLVPAPAVVAGKNMEVFLGAINHGPSDAVGVVVAYELPPGVQLVSPRPNAAISFDLQTRTLQWQVGDLPEKAGRNSVSLKVVIRVLPSTRGDLEQLIHHKARVSTTDMDLGPGNNSRTVPTMVTAVAELSLDGSSAPASAIAGKKEGLQYAVKICNVEELSDATDVEVTGLVPEGMVFESASPSTGFDGTSGIWSVGTLIPKACATINVTLTVGSGRRGLHEWEVKATANEAPPISKTLSTTVKGEADLTLSIEASPSPAVAGGLLVFKIRLENAKPSDATDVKVTVTFPGGVEFEFPDDTPPSGVTIAGREVTWTVDDLPPNSSAEIEIPVRVVPGRKQLLSVTASVAAAEPEPDPPNNGGREVENRTLVTRVADLKVEMSLTGDPETVEREEEVIYELTVTNLGPSDADLVQVEDVFPALLSMTEWTCTPVVADSGASCESPTGRVPLREIVSLPVKTAIQFQVTGTVQDALPGPLFNSATATALDARDPDPANDTAFSAVPLLSAEPEVTGVKVVSGSFIEGGGVVYRIVLSNNGPAGQPDDPALHELTDVLPDGLVLSHAGARQGTVTVDADGIHWDGSIPSHGIVEVIVFATITGTACTLVENQGTISYTGGVGQATTHDPRLTDSQKTCFRVEKPPTDESCEATPVCPSQ